VIDYSHGSSVEVLAPIFNASQVDVIALNATMDPARYSRSLEEFEHDLEMLASITATLKADLGVRIDAAGEKIFVVDDRGRQLDSGKLLAAMTELTLRGSRGAEEAAHTRGADGAAAGRGRGGLIAAPVTAPSVVETVAKRAGGKMLYTKFLPSALMGAATHEGVRLVGDVAGGFIFPELQPAFDGMYALIKLLEALARYETRLSEVVDNLPPYHLIRTTVNCPWEYKGKVMRILSEQYRERREEPIDGIKIDLGKEWVLVLPDADRPLFHVLAESRSRDAAQALADKYARVVTGLQH
jgi:mannose-1-phosphate guanylyltransferase/phosphomannomutase